MVNQQQAPTTVPTPELIEAVEGLVWQALERIGHRLRRHLPRKNRGPAKLVDPTVVHVRFPVQRDEIARFGILDGVFDRVPEVAARHGLNAQRLRSALVDYVEGLLLGGKPHEYAYVRAVLARTMEG